MFGLVLVCTCISAIIIDYVGPISLRCLACLQTVMCSLTLLFYQGNFHPVFMLGLVLLRTWPSGTNIGNIGPISLRFLIFHKLSCVH